MDDMKVATGEAGSLFARIVCRDQAEIDAVTRKRSIPQANANGQRLGRRAAIDDQHRSGLHSAIRGGADTPSRRALAEKLCQRRSLFLRAALEVLGDLLIEMRSAFVE